MSDAEEESLGEEEAEDDSSDDEDEDEEGEDASSEDEAIEPRVLPDRGTRGNRMGDLLEEDEADREFWGQASSVSISKPAHCVQSPKNGLKRSAAMTLLRLLPTGDIAQRPLSSVCCHRSSSRRRQRTSNGILHLLRTKTFQTLTSTSRCSILKRAACLTLLHHCLCHIRVCAARKACLMACVLLQEDEGEDEGDKDEPKENK